MSLSDFIENLQNKPRHVRVVILWASVGICMLGLFVFWINTLDIGLSLPAQQDQSTEKSITDVKEEIPSLWQSLKAGAGDLFETVQKESENKSNIGSTPTESVNPAEEQAPPPTLP